MSQNFGADVNQKLVRGFATTVAVREGHFEVLEILLKAGASTDAPSSLSCLWELNLIRPHVAVHALATTCCRGFVDVVGTLLKAGLGRPLLLQAGVKTDIMVRLGAWSWDTNTGEEFRVAEPYPLTWCAVEFFEISGDILRLLLKVQSPNAPHNSRTLLHHAVLCGNQAAVRVLLSCGADPETPIRTLRECVKVLALAAADFGLSNKLGHTVISVAGSSKWCLGLERVVLELIQSDEEGLSAAMLAAMKGHVEAFRVLVYAGADVKLFNKSGDTVVSLSEKNGSLDMIEKVMLEYALEKDNRNMAGLFYALHCAARRGDVKAVKLLSGKGYGLDVPDGDGYTPLLLAAIEDHGKTCEFLITHGANCYTKNGRGKTLLDLAVGDAEEVIRDELSRRIKWSTKLGKRNVVCKEVEVGMSQRFRRNRKEKGDAAAEEEGIFRVVTKEDKEVHFVCEGGLVGAEMWVRGIRVVTREATCVRAQTQL
ncbi:hypothetical protein F2Q70_00006164 [Brassica cretica]|uniref:Uncharacterized protein n=1 Tax=Brassica cretica TaxID=69181 RepID=A0A8S9J0W1_BRACR|nr:hypothetical protein F2Q70_00006164 [Brassica cretica]